MGNATEFDLEIMNRAGDRFLDLPGIRWMSGPYEFYCVPAPEQTIEGSEPSGPHMVMSGVLDMQKTEIMLSFDAEKLDPLQFDLKKENTTVQKRMNEALTELYERIVPEAVREFLDRKAPPPARPKRPARPGVEKPPEKAPRPEGQTALERNGDPT